MIRMLNDDQHDTAARAMAPLIVGGGERARRPLLGTTSRWAKSRDIEKSPGTKGESFNVPAGECFTLGGGSTKSISYSGVPNSISFFISGGGHDACTNGAQLTRGGGSGCATAPAGVNWESISVS
ncbi:hypothetical protein DFH06DRAFT_1334232 [Mycena polygramma]|nr:hypothetical protein DFH06DRAFT_1334232 [Mycena polygramma]